jgi:hypothetical protein
MFYGKLDRTGVSTYRMVIQLGEYMEEILITGPGPRGA